MAYLNAFNNRQNIVEALQWTDTRIRQFFGEISGNMGPNGFDVLQQSQASFANVATNLQTLLGPINQPLANRNIALTTPSNYNYQGKTFQLYTLYDIVGWIFSVTGPSHDNATNANYYWPLTALYVMFCRRLINDTRKEAQMFQLTYFKQGTIWRVALGAILDRPGATIKNTIRLNRGQQLRSLNLVTAAQEAGTDTNVRLPSGAARQLFGHCAESFPCMFVAQIKANVTLNTAGGFASRGFTAFPNNSTTFNAGLFLGSLADPCENCQDLIQKVGMNLHNFQV